MSLINDALKQARKTPPRNLPSAVPPLQPAAAADRDGPSPLVWLAPAVVVLLIVAAIFFIAWAVAHHSVKTGATAPETAPSVAQDTPPVTQPAAVPHPTDPPPVNPPDGPKVQAIFYIPGKASAIIDGKSVYPGDKVGIYRVKTIAKSTVTLVGPDNKEIQISVN